MKLMLSTTLMWGAKAEDFFQIVKEYDLYGLEIWHQQTESTDLDGASLAQGVHKLGKSCCVHAKSWDLNFASLNKEIRHASIKAVQSSIDFAASIGATEVTVHPPHATLPMVKEESVITGRDSLCEILDYADKKGVVISLELMEKIPKMLVTSIEEYVEFVGELSDRLTTTLDLAHTDSAEEFLTSLKTLPNLSKLHISNRYPHQYHTPLNDGIFDFHLLLPSLTAANLPMVIEGLDQAPFLLTRENLNYLKELK